MDRIVSVSTMAFDGYSLEVALDELAALGVRHVEPASVDKIFQHLVEEDFCDRRATWLRNELVARRLACLSLSVHMALTGSDSVDRFHRRLEFARNIGARCVNSIAGPIGKLEEFRRNIVAIAERARDLGVMLALENHGDLLDRQQQVLDSSGRSIILRSGSTTIRGTPGTTHGAPSILSKSSRWWRRRRARPREDPQDRGRPPAVGGPGRRGVRPARSCPGVEGADAGRPGQL